MLGFVNTHFKKWLLPHQDNAYRPHFFRAKFIVAFSLFSVLVFVATFAYSHILPRADYLAAVLPGVLTDLANGDRDIYSLQPLKKNPLLIEAAREKALDMARYSYFAHISPTGITPWYWISKSGYKFIYAGENLAINFSESDDVNKAWMDSPTHRANILNGNFSEIGIATAEGVYEGKPTIFVVQMFGRPTAPEPAQASVTKPQTKPVVAVKPAVVAKVLPIRETPTFIAFKNTEQTQPAPSSTEPTELGGLATLGVTQYSKIQDKILTNPGSIMRLVYAGLLALVLLAITLSLVFEVKKHHGRHLVSGVMLVLLIVGLSYLYEHVATASLLVR